MFGSSLLDLDVERFSLKFFSKYSGSQGSFALRPIVIGASVTSRVILFQLTSAPNVAWRLFGSTSITLAGVLTSANVTRSGKSDGAISCTARVRERLATLSRRLSDGGTPFSRAKRLVGPPSGDHDPSFSGLG